MPPVPAAIAYKVQQQIPDLRRRPRLSTFHIFKSTPLSDCRASQDLGYRLSSKRNPCIYGAMANQNTFSLPETIAVLTRTPTAVNALLRGLPDIWVRHNEGEDTWSAYDIVGHLAFAEQTDWMTRVRITLESGETRPFDPLDRFAQLKASRGKSVEQLLDDFIRLRNENLVSLSALNLQPEDLSSPRKTSGVWSGDAIGASVDLGRSRPDSSASTFPCDGSPISRRSWAMERLSGRLAVHGPQLFLTVI